MYLDVVFGIYQKFSVLKIFFHVSPPPSTLSKSLSQSSCKVAELFVCFLL